MIPHVTLQQIQIYPVTDAAAAHASQERFATGHLLESAALGWFYGHYQNDPADRFDWRFSPLRAANLSGLAPAYMVLADHDPLLDEGLAYGRRLEESHVPVDIAAQPGMIHDFRRMPAITTGATRARQQIVEVLSKVGSTIP
jgi:acetyl esterase